MTTRVTIAILVFLLQPFVALASTPVERAARLLDEGDTTAARVILDRELAENPESPYALSLLGRVLLGQEDYDGAIETFRSSVKLDDDNSGYHTWLGRAYIEKLQTVSFFEKGILAGRAQEHLKKAIKLDPANVQARIFLANYYLNAPSIAGGSAKKALAQAEEIVKHAPLEGKALMAGIHARRKEHDKAIPLYQELIEASPENTSYRYRLGMAYQKTQQFDLAFDALEALLEVDPGATAALYQVGRTAVFSGTNLDRAIACMHDYLSREVKPGHPGHHAARWRLGMLYEHQGLKSKARAEYEAALSVEPDNDAYQKALAELDQD